MFGGFLLSVYAKYPNKRLYWSKENGTPSIFAEAMRCNRFEIILHHIHFNENVAIDKEDRLYKLRLLLSHLSQKFLELVTLEEHLCNDESMISYYGRHYAKQYIRGKPIRFGFKHWALCTSTGYMLAFHVYVGKQKKQ